MNFSNLWSMILVSYESLLVLLITAVTCAIIGSFLVLRKLSMVSDAISHSVLLGIVLAFFITNDITSPWLIVGAALFGVVTVFSIEVLSHSGLVKNDDAVGIVFPLFFSIAVILITKYARNAHLDTDMVLMGEVIMAPLYRMNFLGHSFPKALIHMSFVFIINLIFIFVFFKELKVTTFDQEFATIAGFSSAILFYALMTLSSLTAVVAFDAVGAILVVSFLITPGASAYLISKDLKVMILLASLYAVVNAVLGYLLALIYQVSMSGMTATIAGLTFFLTFLFHKKGFITSMFLRRQKKKAFYFNLMLMHIGNHMNTPEEKDELGLYSMKNHLKWRQEEIQKKANHLIKQGLVFTNEKNNTYALTKEGLLKYQALKSEYGVVKNEFK